MAAFFHQQPAPELFREGGESRREGERERRRRNQPSLEMERKWELQQQDGWMDEGKWEKEKLFRTETTDIWLPNASGHYAMTDVCFRSD
jgi:hypothetical protein